MSLVIAVFPFHRRCHVLAPPRYFWMARVVLFHVAATAAAGGEDACFYGWGCEAALGGIVDGGADVAYFAY